MYMTLAHHNGCGSMTNLLWLVGKVLRQRLQAYLYPGQENIS